MSEVSGWVIGRIFSGIKSRLISKEQRKEKHLEDIKKEVLEPMLQILDNTYIAALKGDEAIIVSTSKQEFEKTTDPTKYEGKTEEGIDIISPYSESIWDFDNSAPQINENLYTDIKENHYNEFVANYEAFLNEFAKYSEKWLSYSHEIEKIFLNELDLPLYNGDIGKPFFNPKKLAVYTIGRIRGNNPTEVFVQDREYDKDQ